MILAGEIQTGWLRHSTAVDPGTAVSLVSLKAGTRARYGDRPVRYAVSPDLLTGLDCKLAEEKDVRGVGTVISKAILTGGHVLQGSTHVYIVRSEAGRRLPWGYYMSKPGTVETINSADPDNLANGFLSAPEAPLTMDLGAVNGQILNRVQGNQELDLKVPIKGGPIRVRWVAIAAKEEPPALRFTLQSDGMRSIELRLPELDQRSVVALCEDIALHDWMLSCAQRRLDASRIGAVTRAEAISRLAPVVTFMFHLWMPASRLNDEMRAIWRGFEEESRFSTQWTALSNRIRDQLHLAAAGASG